MLLHCVVDAILGALGLPDIGQIFPDSDPKWKGAASSVFMKEAVSQFFLSTTQKKKKEIFFDALAMRECKSYCFTEFITRLLPGNDDMVAVLPSELLLLPL